MSEPQNPRETAPLLIAHPQIAFSPAAERNRAPIADALKPLITMYQERSEPSQTLRLLEVASGTGQHAAYLARRYPLLSIQPTDRALDARDAVAGWASEAGVSERVAPLKLLDVTQPLARWSAQSETLIYCANMVHIAPWSAACGLFAGAGVMLVEGGSLILYGPFRFPNQALAPSNVSFDQSLRARDPAWGIRDIDALDELALNAGLKRVETLALPANNHLLIYRR